MHDAQLMTHDAWKHEHEVDASQGGALAFFVLLVLYYLSLLLPFALCCRRAPPRAWSFS
jgi:hypothetical protein